MKIANSFLAGLLLIGSLGATATAMAADDGILLKQISYQASLIPTIDSLKSLGIVWIPGLMAGMLLSAQIRSMLRSTIFVTISIMISASGLTGFDKRPADSQSRILARRATHPAAPNRRSSARKSEWVRMRVRNEE